MDIATIVTAVGIVVGVAGALGAGIVLMRRGGLREVVDIQDRTIKALETDNQQLRERLANVEGQVDVLRSSVVTELAGAIAKAVVQAIQSEPVRKRA